MVAITLSEDFRRASTLAVEVDPDPNALTLVPRARTDTMPAAGPLPRPEPTAASRYELVGRLGAGGMGEVLAAKDRALRRVVAFKRLLPEAASRASVLGRFLSEAQITSQLDHPNVVPIYGLEVGDDGAPAYAMKMIDGVELADLLKAAATAVREGRPPEHALAARLEVFVKVLDAMSFAHSRGVIHRDLKPANVMVGRHGQVYVVDWGIARVVGARSLPDDPDPDPVAADDDATRTRAGQALGTPAYMSPEQARGDNDALDARSDVFTLGLILQEVVTLQRARAAAGLSQTILAAAEGERSPIATLDGRAVPADLAAIVDKACAPAVADRYASVDALATDVRAFLRGDAVSARPDNAARKAARWVAKNRGKALAIGLVAIVVLPLVAIIAAMVVHEGHVAELTARHERLAAIAGAVAERAAAIDETLERHEAVADEIAGYVIGAAAGSPGLERHLAARLAHAPGLDAIALDDGAGHTLHAPRDSRLGVAAGNGVWSVRGDALVYARPIVGDDGKPLGAVTLEVSPAALREAVALAADPAVVETMLVRDDGVIAAHVTHGQPLGSERSIGELGARLGSAPAGLDGDGTVWHRVGNLGWSYVVKVDLDAAAADPDERPGR